MSKITISITIGIENLKNTSFEVSSPILRKTLAFYLGCSESDLINIEKANGVVPVTKPKLTGGSAYLYELDDFPKMVQGVKEITKPGSDIYRILSDVDTSKPEFEIVYQSSKIKFSA